MGIDNIDELKPPPYPRNLHNPRTCGGPGICVTCSGRTQAEQEISDT